MNTQPVVANVSAQLVRAVLLFAATEDVRYYLNGVYLHPSKDGGVLICATDGHMMLCIHDEEGQATRPVIVPLNNREHSRLLKPDRRLIFGEDKKFTITDQHGIVEWIGPREEIVGKYPNIFELIGDFAQWQEGMQGTFNPKLLARLTKIQSRYLNVRFFHKEGNKTSTLFTIKRPKAFGVVMAMRFDDQENGLAAVIPSDFQKAA